MSRIPRRLSSDLLSDCIEPAVTVKIVAARNQLLRPSGQEEAVPPPSEGSTFGHSFSVMATVVLPHADQDMSQIPRRLRSELPSDCIEPAVTVNVVV